MRVTFIACSAFLATAACGPPADVPPAPMPPADAPVATEPNIDVGAPIDALGTEPFWRLQIRADHLTLARPDHQELRATHSGAEGRGAAGVWQARTPAGPALVVTVTKQACSDGMSDLSYPYAATVEVEAQVLRGCAAPAADWPASPDAR
jgi:uncharacterized membrane protein